MGIGGFWFAFVFFLGLHSFGTPVFSAELLKNGDFELGVVPLPAGQTHKNYGVAYEIILNSGWHSIMPSTPDLWSTRNQYVPLNFFGMTKDLLKNGRINETQLGMDVSPNWNEVVMQKLGETLGEGIEYSASFWASRSKEDQAGWFEDLTGSGNPTWHPWPVPDAAQRLFAAIFPESLTPPYANEGLQYESFYGPHIKVSTDPSLSQYPDDPTDRDWHQIQGSFTARGDERIFALSSIPRAGTFKGYYFFDDVSLSCTPEAAFRFSEPSELVMNGITWQILTAGTSEIQPETAWNSKLSLWLIEEVDAYGKQIAGGFSRQIQIRDQPKLRGNETLDLSPYVPPEASLRYYRITHLNSCVSSPAMWESKAVRWILVPWVDITLKTPSAHCAEESLSMNYSVNAGEIPILGIQALLIDGTQVIESRTLPPVAGSGQLTFKSPQAPGVYYARLEVTIDAGSGKRATLSRTFSFEIKAPTLKLSGPDSVQIGENALFLASSNLSQLPTQVHWSRENESLQWVSSGNSSLQSQFAWSAPGTYGVRARAVWYPRCFADADTSIEVRDAAPEFRVEFGGKFSCSETGQMSGVLHLQDHSFKILGIEGRILQGGNLVKSFSIDPALRDGEFRFNRPEAPGQYLLEVQVTYEILPGVQKTLLRQLPFQVELPAMSLTGPAYLRAGEEGSYRAEHTGVSAPRIYWSYPGDGGVFYSAVPGGLTRSLMWKDRGSHEVTVDAIWSDACRVSAKVNTRVIGQETVFFPNAFTPNGDQTNDRYGPKGQDMRITRFEIYDRWGAKVYSAEAAEIDRLQGWDGTVQGKMAPDGVFVCVAEYESLITHEKKTYRGTVTLLR
jgi:gliding motility-associated-like protein